MSVARPNLALLAAKLACRDLLRDFRMTLCLLASVAAVVAPLLVLFGLRYGVVESLRDELRRTPTTLELRPLTQGRFDSQFFARLRERPEVSFLEPTPRFLSTILSLSSVKQAEGAEPVQVDLLPSRPGDPLLGGFVLSSPPTNGIILSRPAAEQLGVAAGDVVTARIARVHHEARQVVTRNLSVAAVLPLERLRREAALVEPNFVLALEDYLEGRESPYFGTDGEVRPQGAREFAGFRLFASDIDTVEPLRDWLVGEGLTIDTAATEIAVVRRLDRALGVLFVVIAGLGGSGAVLGLMVSLWGNVERKRHDLGVMRLIGFPSMAMAAFPVVQALTIGAAGAGLSILLALLAGPAVDRLLAGTVAAGLVAYRLPVGALGVTVVITMVAAGAAAGVAGAVAAKLDPADTLRRV